MESIVTGFITALIVAFEVTTGATARRDAVGWMAKAWLATCVPPALVAPDHSMWQVFVAGLGVVVAVATVGRWLQERDRTPPPPPPLTREDTHQLLERAHREVRSSAPKVPHPSAS